MRSVKLGYRPALDGVRAVAIACVVLFHTVGFPEAGALGVDLFFVLSGFLITTLLLDERARSGAVSLRNFYRRRALRLLPALVVMLGVFLAFSVLAVLAHGGSLDRAFFGVAAGLGYFSNFALAAEPETRAMPNELRHLWSLAIEEQFYIVWPVVLFLVLRARVRLALIAVAGGIFFTIAEQMRLYLEGESYPRMGFAIDTRSSSILVGCLLALALTTAARPRLEALARRIGPVAVALFVALLMVDLQRRLFTGPLLVVAIGSAALILLALDNRSWLARGLSIAPMVFLGRISYSLYLWHVPIFVAFGLHGRQAEFMDLPALALALGCATASYYFIEMPFLRRKARPVPIGDEYELPSVAVGRGLAPSSSSAVAA